LFLFEPNSFIPLATVQDEKTYWYQCDQVGAPQELTDREGNIVWAADYKVWGETTLRKTGTDGSARYSRRRQAEPPPVLEQPFRFQGQQFDEETGLHYNRYRYYDPGVGRFVSQDPIGLLGGSNLFAYAPNPMGWVDPSGLNNKCPSCLKSRGYDRPEVETKSGKAVKQKNATDEWDNFLGENQTNIDPRDGMPDPDRIWSADGKRSIRFGQHEMNSSPKKLHYHQETWHANKVENVLQRIPQ
jgi:RHS repeat-associated protein